METKESLRERLNKGVAPLGNLKISLVHLILLIIINLSLAAIIVNLFVRGKGVFEWWSVYLTAFLIFAYLIMRIFTSSGIILGRQVTFLITLFNLFLNLMKVFGMVKSDQYWELTFLIPLVNLICLLFLVFVFAVRKKKFRAIIVPSLKIALVSVIPIVRLYISQGNNYILPVFNYVVLLLALALFFNALLLNYLTIKKIAETNIEMVKKSAQELKKAGEKVSAVNRKIEKINQCVVKVKSFWQSSLDAFKQFFTFKKKKKKLSSPSAPLLEQKADFDQNGTDGLQNGKEIAAVQVHALRSANGGMSKPKNIYQKLWDKLKKRGGQGQEQKAQDIEAVQRASGGEELVLCDKEESDIESGKNLLKKIIKRRK